MSREPNRNVYVGHRYVPLILEEWDNKISYEGLSVVTHKGNSYTSKKRVPVGIDILNKEFWSLTGNYNAQVEYYRDETERVAEDLLLKSDQTYVDTELDKKSDQTYVDTELGKKANKTYVDTELNKKSNLDYVNTELDKKSDQTYVDTELGKKSNQTYVDTELGKKSNQTYVDTELGKKSDITYVDTELGKKVYKDELFINVKDYGAKGDGVTNDNESILNAINSGSEGSTYIFPDGDYLVNDLHLLLPNESQVIFGGRFIIDDNVEQFGVRIGEYSSRTSRIDLKGIKVNKKNNEINGNITGLSLVNIYESNIDVRKVTGFGYGLVLEADGNGFVYNQMYLGVINDNRINLDMNIGTGGWINENTFHGGWFTWSTSLTNVYGDGFIHLNIPDNEEHSANNNLFIKPSFEGGNSQCHALKMAGTDNTVIQARYETSSIVELLGNNNVLFYGYGLFSRNLIDNGSRNKIYDRNKITLSGGTATQSVLSVKPTNGTGNGLQVNNPVGEETFSVNGLGHINAENIAFNTLKAKRVLSGGVIDPTTMSPSGTLQLRDENNEFVGYIPIYKPL